MRISDWSSDVCSSDLVTWSGLLPGPARHRGRGLRERCQAQNRDEHGGSERDQGPQGTFTPGEPEPDQDGSDEVEPHHRRVRCGDRKSAVSGTSVPVRVEPGGRGNIQKNKKRKN